MDDGSGQLYPVSNIMIRDTPRELFGWKAIPVCVIGDDESVISMKNDWQLVFPFEEKTKIPNGPWQVP